MAYAIERQENVHDAVVRIMNEQIARAREHLVDAKSEKSIHDARKRLKETRAVARMVREPLGAQFAIENAWIRDAGRELAGVRDAQAVMEALEKLAASKKIHRMTLWKSRHALQRRRDAFSASQMEAHVASVLTKLDGLLTRLASWPALGSEFDSIADGLARTYRNGRKAMDVALLTHSPSELHEWRKRVKEHWYHAQLLRHVWPSMMKAYASMLEDLSHALGDHHDLFVLRGIVASSPREFGRSSRVSVGLLDLIDARQKELEALAADIGSRIYAESPKAWLARMQNYWSAWRAQ